MSMTGSVESGNVLRGKLNGLKTIHGYSAYEVAVICGFEGTEEEWLASLKGRGIENIEAVSDGLKITYTDDAVEIVPIGNISANTRVARVAEINLLSGKWVGEGSLHSQVVDMDVTENSQVDITPSAEQLVAFYEKDLTFVTENEGGVVTVYAIGQKPENDYTFQVTITEVEV